MIRPATRGDDADLARLLAGGWREAYAGFMPERLLRTRGDPVHRLAEIAGWLDTEFEPDNEVLYVAETDAVHGFVHVVLGDKADLGAAGFVSLLYVDAAQQGKGIGRRLMSAAAQWLLSKAEGPLVLSAFEHNPWRRFYNRLGGQEAKRVTGEIDGHPVESVLYVWPDPRALL